MTNSWGEDDSSLSDEELDRVVALIRPCFAVHASKYDERKYPPDVYQNLLVAFAAPETIIDADIRTAVVWKFGHFGKRRIPHHHEQLISLIQQRWKALSMVLIGSTKELHDRLVAAIGGRNRFITVSFILHLLRPNEVPIIDQHNFRAMNFYLADVHPGWKSKSKPSTFDDLLVLLRFMNGIISAWDRCEESTAPSKPSLDRFLMMYGKALKRKVPIGRPAVTAAIASFQPETIPADLDKRFWIRLPYGGAGAGFEVEKLLQYIDKSGRSSIIQGQNNCRLVFHPKPNSLDAWLRQNFSQNGDTKQAVNAVVDELVATGLFREGRFTCPDSGRRCKGLLRLLA